MTPSEVRQLRGEATRAEFASLVGVNAHTVYRWELPDDSPHARRPRGAVLARLDRIAHETRESAGGNTDEVIAALQRLMDAGDWRATEAVFLRAQRDAGADVRSLAATGLAMIELVYHADCRRALAALGPALAPGAPASALVEAIAALAYSYPDGELFDLGRVHAHAARVDMLAGAPGGNESPTARAMSAMAEVNAALLCGNDDLLVRSLARAEAIATAALPELPAMFLDQMRALSANVSGQSRLALERLDRLLANPKLATCPLLEARVCAMRAMRMLEDLGDPEEALALARRARRVADAARLEPGVHTALALRSEGEALLRLVRLRELAEVFAESDRILDVLGFPVTIVFPVQARYLLSTGQAGALVALSNKIGAIDLPSMRAVCQAYAAWLAAVACVSRGDEPEVTMAAYEHAEQLCNGWAFMERDLLVAFASAAVIDGDVARARGVFERALRAADRRPAAWVTASLRRVEGTLLVEEGRREEGRALFDAAVATFAASGDRLDALFARYGSAGMARCFGEPDAAARVAAAEHDLAVAGLPHPGWIDRAIARLARTVVLPATRSAPAPYAAPSATSSLAILVRRLAVAGATTAMVKRELVAVAREVCGGAPVDLVDGMSTAIASGAVAVVDVDGGSGRRMQLVVGHPCPIVELEGMTETLRVVAIAGGLALEVAALRGSGVASFSPASSTAVLPPEPDLPGVIAVSPVMRRLFADVGRLAASRATIIISGESGAGKEVVARALHQLSPRAKQPYVAFNCAAVPHDLFEGQLFGYRKGAFTGAAADHVGVVRAADHGTVFLDEIGELPLDIQPKLLRFLDSGEVFPLGAPRPLIVDVRVVAATNRDLAAEVARGRFREDLFYRLQVVPLLVPPLRDRKEDIIPLARAFARALAPPDKTAAFAPDALAAITAYRWPGNVRELRNAIERAMAFSDRGDLITRADLGIG